MKVVDTLAAIGVMTIVFVAVKTAMAINEIINGPFPKEEKTGS